MTSRRECDLINQSKKYKKPPMEDPQLSQLWSLLKQSDRQILSDAYSFIPNILPCDVCLYVITTVSSLQGRQKCVIPREQEALYRSQMDCLPKKLKAPKLGKSGSKLSCTCLNCSLQFVISTRWYRHCFQSSLKDNARYYMQYANFMSIHGFHRNYLISKRMINDKDMFIQLFCYLGQLLIDSKSNDSLRMFIVQDLRCLLYKLLTTTKYLKKDKHCRWIVKYCKSVLDELLHNCCQTILNIPLNVLMSRYREGRVTDMVLCGISICVDLIMNRIKKYNISVYYTFIHTHCCGHISAFETHPYHGHDPYVYAMVNNHHEEIHKGDMRCGNVKCDNKYLMYKYGNRASEVYDVRLHEGYFQTGWKEWKPLKPIRKWYICSGCKLIYYCSRKCQKMSWNRQNHKFHCLELHRSI
eukprot:1037155_1